MKKAIIILALSASLFFAVSQQPAQAGIPGCRLIYGTVFCGGGLPR